MNEQDETPGFIRAVADAERKLTLLRAQRDAASRAYRTGYDELYGVYDAEGRLLGHDTGRSITTRADQLLEMSVRAALAELQRTATEIESVQAEYDTADRAFRDIADGRTDFLY